MLPLVAAATLVGACADNRISVQQLRTLEAECVAHAETAPAPPPPPVEYQPTLAPRYRVVPGDILLVTLYGLADNPYEATKLELRVQHDGALLFPIVGAIDVQGADLAGVENAIRAAHVPKVVTDLSVYVEVRQTEQTAVLVNGAVGLPGLIRLDENERDVVHALARAGGFTPNGSGHVTVTPINSSRAPRTYDFNDINDVRTALLAEPLESGDLIEVTSAEQSAIYVMGVLNRPVVVPLNRGGQLSVLRVIASSGGLVDFIEPEFATLWRMLPDGRQVRVKLNLDKIRNGEAEDILLASGDILDVPHTAGSRFRQWFANNIRLGPFGVTAMYDPVADYRARILRNENNNSINGAFLDILGRGVSNVIVPTTSP